MSSREVFPVVFLSSFLCCFCLRFSAFFFSMSFLLNDVGLAIFSCLCENLTPFPVLCCLYYVFVSGCLYRRVDRFLFRRCCYQSGFPVRGSCFSSC